MIAASYWHTHSPSHVASVAVSGHLELSLNQVDLVNSCNGFKP